jgi:hypothetical protein
VVGRQPGWDPAVYVAGGWGVGGLLDPRHVGGLGVLAWARPNDEAESPTLPGFADTP